MAKEIDKIIQSKTAPKSNNVLWDDGENLKINRNGKWESTGGGAPMINITYANLVELRNNSKLIAGMQYRITDYVTTTAQENTRSAGHQFDVIVTAYSASSKVKMLYVGLFSHDGKECHLYESEDHFIQMLMDFNVVINLSYFNTSAEYPYTIFPSYTRWNNEGPWSEWSTGEEEGETICFKHNPTANYFNSSNLAAWQIWYSLDNDAERFAWASNKEAISDRYHIYYRNPSLDTTNNGVLYYAWSNEYEDITVYTIKEIPTEGEFVYDDIFAENSEITKVITKGKGVIYRMIDEWNKDCPYDFKNIQFKRDIYAGGGGIVKGSPGDEDFNVFCYTFSWEDKEQVIMDASIVGNNGYLLNDEGQIIGVYGNIIKDYITYTEAFESSKIAQRHLNNIVFLSTYSYEGRFFYGCYGNTFGNDCFSNSFGNYCLNNYIGNGCNSVEFDDSSRHRTVSINSDGTRVAFNLADLISYLSNV